MNCIFVGNPVPKDFLVKTVNKNFSIADNIAQNCIIEGLFKKYEDDLIVISTAANFDEPNKLNRVTKKEVVELDCGAKAIAVGNLNYNKAIYYVSIIITYTICLIEQLRFAKRKGKKSPFVIITNGPYIFTSIPVFISRLFYKICYIPFLVGSVELPEYKGVFKLISKLSPIMIKMADATITYVEKSSRDYTSKPYLSIIYSLDQKLIDQSNELYKYGDKKNDKLTILYSGALTKIKGIDKLINVIRKASGMFEWIICGEGEYANEIQKLASDVKYHLSYLGIVKHERVIELQHKADVLIALQSVETPIYKYYSRYAASGKLIEYLLSGTPVLSPNLDNISKEIKPYLNILENQDADTILNFIVSLEEPDIRAKVIKKAISGRNYVLRTANNAYQNKKILRFIEEVYKDKFNIK